MMQRWTNDRWRSTLHSVANPQMEAHTSQHMSIGFFLHPITTPWSGMPSCIDPERRPITGPVLAGEMMRAKQEAHAV